MDTRDSGGPRALWSLHLPSVRHGASPCVRKLQGRGAASRVSGSFPECGPGGRVGSGVRALGLPLLLSDLVGLRAALRVPSFAACLRAASEARKALMAVLPSCLRESHQFYLSVWYIPPMSAI